MRDDYVSPFDAFTLVLKILTWAGFYKLDSPTKRWKIILYAIYKRIILLVVAIYITQYFMYSLQLENEMDQVIAALMYFMPQSCGFLKAYHMLFYLPKIECINNFLKGNREEFIFQARHDVEKLVNSLTLALPHMTCLLKALTMYVQFTRIKKLNTFLEGETFRSSSEEDEKILKKHVENMNRLCKVVVLFNISISAFFWLLSSIVKRVVNGEHDVIPMYFPYRTDTTFGFCLLIFNQMGTLLWTGYGHVAIDILMTTYYAQAHIQLKIIKQQLSGLLDDGVHGDKDYLKHNFIYRDLTNTNLKHKFVMIVQRYDKLVWYMNEVTTTFNFPISIQFFTSVATMCFVVYSMTRVSVMTLPFMFLVVLIGVVLMQPFLYCLVGNNIYIENESINNAMYNSDWLSLSPSFRRLLLIAMTRWSRPMQPTVFGIIKLSLTTFLSMLKSSYTLFTVLMTSGGTDEF